MRTNEELVTAIQAGNIEELQQLWEQCYRFICLQAIKWKRAWENRTDFDIDDLTQSGYIALCEAVQGYNQDRGKSFINYLVYFLKREFSKATGCYTPAQAKDPLNNAYSLDAPISTDPDNETTFGEALPCDELGYEEIEERLQRTYTAKVIHQAMDSLPDNQRIAIQEHYLNGKSFAEIGAALNVASTTARGYADRGCERLRIGKHAPTLSELLWGERDFYRHTGYTAWKETGCSVQEWTLLWKEREIKRHKLKDTREAKTRYCVDVLGMDRGTAELLFAK